MNALSRAAAAAPLLVASLAVSACVVASPVPPVSPEALPPVVGDAQVAAAEKALAGLPAAGAPHTAGYSRGEFGEPWADVDHNGCDTRNDILARDLDHETVARNGCTVRDGDLHDPYTGQRIRFRRGAGTSSDVQIDHLYPLHRAWLHGAWRWTAQRREQFANDRGNLLAVAGKANTAKGDSGPAEWAPPWRPYRCAYAVDYIDVARIYRLPVTAADRRTLSRMLVACPHRPEQ